MYLKIIGECAQVSNLMKISTLFHLFELMLICICVLQIRELKLKLNEEKIESNTLSVVKEEIIVPETENKALVEESKPPPPVMTSSLAASETEQEVLNYGGVAPMIPEVKDGSSDSDSSAILNDDNSPNAAISSSGILQNQPHTPLLSPSSSSLKSPSCFQYSKASNYQTQFVKMEEHNFFTEEACNFFSDDQPPILQWYCSEPWS